MTFKNEESNDEGRFTDLHSSPTTPVWGRGFKPQIMSKIILNYPSLLRQTRFNEGGW